MAGQKIASLCSAQNSRCISYQILKTLITEKDARKEINPVMVTALKSPIFCPVMKSRMMKAKAFLKDIAESYGYKNDTESSVIQKDTHYKQLLLLRERAEKEKKIKKKKVFFCQDSIYKKFYRLLKEGYTVKEAKRLLMAEYKINRNMLNRDLTEIQKYFEKNDSK